MKKNINLVLSVVIFISIISISTPVSALTSNDIDTLLKSGVITAAQASILNKSISISTNSVTATTNTNNIAGCADITTDIEYSQKDTSANGSAVSILQYFLNKNGYLASTPTGYFGNMTLVALKTFQSANGINSTGYVGPLTRAKIRDLDCGYISSPTNITTTITTTPTATSSIPVITPIANKADSVAPTIKLSVNSTKVAIGKPTTLTWSSTNAVDQCKITSKDSFGKTLSSMIETFGSKSSGPINTSTTYTVICYNKYGIPGSKSVLIEALDPEKLAAQQQITYVQAAVITSIVPSSGNRGDVVKILGSNFLSSNQIFFDGTKIDNNLILSQSSTSISFKIPEYKSCLSASCLPPTTDTKVETGGRKIVQVSNTNGFSNDFVFTIPSKIITIPGTPTVTPYTPPKLAISSIKPTSGNRGDTATISGSGFSSDSTVFLGGFKVADNLIVSKNNSQISFIIPPFQMGCTEPEYEICPRLPLSGSGTIIETGGVKNIYVMNILSKSTTTPVTFTLPSKKITY